MKIVVLGSNPSQKSPDDSAFSIHTRSGKIIRRWFSEIEGICFLNVSNIPTPNNKPLSTAEIKYNLPRLRELLQDVDKIIAIGNTATYACELLGVPFFKMNHPSGRCRKNNDPALIKARVEEMRNWVTN
jgi:hypothetical protein